MIINKVRFLLVTLICCLVTIWLYGCTTIIKLYEGENKDLDKIAIVSIKRPWWLTQIDGNYAVKNPSTRFGGEKLILHMLPGKHTISAEYLAMGCLRRITSPKTEIVFDVKPGKSYIVSFDQEAIQRNTLLMFVVDESTQTIVSE
jgi:hypothetical protein